MKCSKCNKNNMEIWPVDNQGSKLDKEGYCRDCKIPYVSDEEQKDIERLYGEPKKMEKRAPRSKTANNHDTRDTMQPFKKMDGKLVENKAFMEVHGTEQLHNYDKEKAEWYEKKGYDKYKRISVS